MQLYIGCRYKVFIHKLIEKLKGMPLMPIYYLQKIN